MPPRFRANSRENLEGWIERRVLGVLATRGARDDMTHPAHPQSFSNRLGITAAAYSTPNGRRRLASEARAARRRKIES